MIGIVVGVNLISPVNDVVQTITTPTYASSVVSLTGVLVIIFVTVIILGAVAWIDILTETCPRKIRQIRGTLNSLTSKLTTELTLRLNQDNVERLDGEYALSSIMV